MRNICRDIVKVYNDSYYDDCNYYEQKCLEKAYTYFLKRVANLIYYLSLTLLGMVAFTLSATFVFGFLLNKIKATPKAAFYIKILSFTAFIPISLIFSYVSMILGFKINTSRSKTFDEEEENAPRYIFANLWTFLIHPLFQMISLFFALITPFFKIPNYTILTKTIKIALFTAAGNVLATIPSMLPFIMTPLKDINRKTHASKTKRFFSLF